MNFMSFLSHGHGNYGFVAFTLPLLIVAAGWLQVTTIRQARETEAYAKAWPVLWLVCCSWCGWAAWILIAIVTGSGLGGLGLLVAGPLGLAVLGQAPFVLRQLLLNPPRSELEPSRAEVHAIVPPATLVLITLVPALGALRILPLRFPGVEFGTMAFAAIVWGMSNRRPARAYAWNWTILCGVVAVHLPVGILFLIHTVRKVAGGGHLIEFTHFGPTWSRVGLWLIDEPALFYPFAVMFGELLVQRPPHLGFGQFLLWLLIALAMVVAVVLQIALGLI